jgi:hypothetical protein
VIAVIAVLAAMLLVAVVAISLFFGTGGENGPQNDSTSPLAVAGAPAPDAGSPRCADLLTALPPSLRSGGRMLAGRALAAPAPRATRAWGGDPAVVLRCGVARPGELTPTAQLRVVSGVRWLPVPGTGATTWYVVDRPVFAALTVPEGIGTGALQTVSAKIRAVLPQAPVRVR